MRKTLFIAVVLLFAAMVMVPAHAAPKNVYYVDDDGGYDFTTIQAAIDACISGDKIHVYSGNYIENLVIDVSISLTGEDPASTIIDGSGGSNCIYAYRDQRGWGTICRNRHRVDFYSQPAVWVCLPSHR